MEPVRGRARRGRLTVYLGAAPGVGQDLRDARRGPAAARRAAPTWWSATSRPTAARTPPAQLEGLEVVPRTRGRLPRHDLHRDGHRRGARPRRRRWCCVDELAHTNVPGSRHEKRAEDVEELRARRHRRHHHRQHPAPRVAQRRGRADHRRPPARDRARTRWSAPPTRSSWSTCRPRRCAAGWRTATSTRPSRSTPRSRRTSGSAT